ncbi:EAL domain-containing protein [Hansschlegelia quercus]|uniref:EAL domain-containing protein n=1 Tax=Hansschlegelia quercus TaxID=2528245 RepID=A0A4V2JE83_9HYPH|nr:EAL domain-containing protein [Hansschlegelia quercus]TBN54266.1 EAL domain-containing protein [Hansschlegelia quercus]
MAQDGGHSWKRALLTGLAIAAGPIIGLNALLAMNIAATSQSEVDEIAAKVLTVAERRLDESAAMLISMGMKGVAKCADLSREVALGSPLQAPSASEVGFVDPQGVARCAAFGQPRVVRLTSAEHGTTNPDVFLSTVRIGETSPQQFVRLQWRNPDGSALRVLVPGENLLPEFLRSAVGASFIVELVMIDGGQITRRYLDPLLMNEQPSIIPKISARAASQRYPMKVEIEVPGAATAKANEGLFLYANLCSLVFAAVVATVAILISRRSGGPVREIADGIRRGEFVPYYQPVIDIVTGRLKGCEVLVRWRKPDGRMAPPGSFIGLAEASDQIFPLTRALMESARDDLGEAYRARPGLKVGFNLVARHFDDVSIVDDVERIFAGSPIGMGQLMFEVTERQPLTDIPRARIVISKLQALGARVALDDVGTGHGGLSYLLKLGVDVMKMDKMFVDAIGTSRYSVAIVDSLVRLASDMNLDLIAEGVETIEQVEYLRGKGVRMAQGYVFAPPLPASSYLALVKAMTPDVAEAPRAARTAA